MDKAGIKHDPRNARKHNPRNLAQIESSIQRDGFGRSILLAADGTVIAGNATIDSAASAGLDDVIVVETDGTKVVAVKRTDVAPGSEQFHRLALADNRAAELASWDAEVLAGLNEEMDLSAFFQDEELNRLLASVTTEGKTDPDAVPEVKEARTKPGDLWLLGRHRLLCGDCRDFAAVEHLFDGARANVVITSPPYASQRKYDESSGFRPIAPNAYADWFRDVATNIMAVLADDGSYFLNIKEHADEGQRDLYVKDLTIAHVREWGWMLVDEFCWRNVRNGVPGGWPNRFKNAWEPVFHFARQASIKFRPDAVATPSDEVFSYSPDNSTAKSGSGLLGVDRAPSRPGLARHSNVVECPAETGQGNHTAPFPVALPEFFISAFSDAGDVVYDPFMGSGTTLIAADRTDRVGVGMEISPRYCDVIVKRWEDFTGQTATLEPIALAAD